MVLGLIDFLLGGKKKNKTSKSGQVSAPLTNVGGSNSSISNSNNSTSLPDGISTSTQNANQQDSNSANNLEFQDSNKSDVNANGVANNVVTPNNFQSGGNSSSNSNNPNRKSVSEVISKIHDELKNTNEKIGELVSDIKGVENNLNTLTHRIEDLEESKKITDEKLSEIDNNMTKFLSLYELINNQYNPFVEKETITIPAEKKEIVLEATGQETISQEDLSKKIKNIDSGKGGISFDAKDLNSSLLELDTLNIEEAAGNAVPLTALKNNTNSLVIILSWLEYLIKKVGLDETRNSLRYYTETLRWITPEVFFDLDKYLRGMNDRDNLTGKERLNVRDHIVSLYFISKLNEKTLDEKLTRAVLQIIKE